jgi:hypothetical protein
MRHGWGCMRPTKPRGTAPQASQVNAASSMTQVDPPLSLAPQLVNPPLFTSASVVCLCSSRPCGHGRPWACRASEPPLHAHSLSTHLPLHLSQPPSPSLFMPADGSCGGGRGGGRKGRREGGRRKRGRRRDCIFLPVSSSSLVAFSASSARRLPSEELSRHKTAGNQHWAS